MNLSCGARDHQERDGVAVGIPAGKAPVTLVGTGVQRHQGEGPSLLGQIGREQRLGFLPAHRGGGGIVGFVPCVVVGRCVCAGVLWGGITGGIGGVVGGLVVIGRGLRVLRVVWGGGPVRRGRGLPLGVSSVLFCLLLCILRRVLRAVWVVGGGGIAFLAASGGVLLGPLKDFNDCLWQESICSPPFGPPLEPGE